MARKPTSINPVLQTLLDTRRGPQYVTDATAQGTVNPNAPGSGVIGISDPRTLLTSIVDVAVSVGAQAIRAEFHWSQIEPSEGSAYQWAPYDAMVANATSHGLGISGIVTYIPDWLLAKGWPDIEARFIPFVEVLFERYPDVETWEIFNEPNLPGYGWLKKSSESGWSGIKAFDFAGEYLILLARANVALRQKAPDGWIVLGGLANHSSDGSFVDLETWVGFVHQYGGLPCYDIFAFHPYGYQAQFPAARARVDAVNTGNRSVWFNEYGWTDWQAMDMAINPDYEANPLIRTLTDADAQCDVFFHFALADYSVSGPAFGLYSYSGSRRPGADTFQWYMGQR